MDKSSSTQRYHTRIAGTGSYLPEKLLTNKDLEKLVDTDDQWIRERTGISSRHMASDEEATSDLALRASQIALREAGLDAKDLDMILVATVSPDMVMPNTACLLQQKLGAPDCMALDISAACTGFVYGISIADQFIQTGHSKNILLVGAEVLHRFVDYTDRNTCILFGDGAGACVLQRTQEGQDSTVYSTHLHADGGISHLFTLPGGGTALPFSQKVLDERLHYVRMNGREIFKHAVRTMSKACDEALTANNMSPEEVNWIIPHQANVRIMEAVAKHFGVSMDKVLNEIEDMANISAATVIVAMDRAIRDGRIQRGHNLLLTAFGAGITSGSALLKY
ncbi:MAG: 3-oxoacyl-ACP synthase [Bdellovibrionaceae bacterium]|nr:3-oxoacyl-ACP synthase [Pseudobdellovibrionaceae bacterium]